MLRFFPVPDPFSPHTMTRENIENAQRMGILHNGSTMYIAANLQMFGEDSKGGALETLPADDLFVSEAGLLGKFWADRFNVPDSYVYFDRGKDQNSGLKIRSVYIKATNIETGGFDDPTFNIYNPRCAQFYREFAELVMAWGGVPALRLYANEYGDATKRLSFPNDSGRPLPSVAIPLKLMPGDGTGLGELVFRFNPENGCVEYFSPQEFFEAIREKKLDVKDEIERALRLRRPSRLRCFRTRQVSSLPAGGTIIPAPPVTVNAPLAAAAEAFSEWDGLTINNSTGEAIVNGIQTGLFFERPAQSIPFGENPDVQRQLRLISPLSFATAYTADLVLNRLREALPGWSFTTVMGDPNKQFPVSVLARYVAVKLENGAIVPAGNIGLIAQTAARTTAEVSDGRGGAKVVKNWSQAIEMAVGEIRRAVDDYQAKMK